MQLRKILVAVDPQSGDTHPLPLALDLAARAGAGARLTVLSVWETPWQLLDGPAPDAAEMPSRNELLALASRRLATRLAPHIDGRLRDRVAMHVAIGLPGVEIPRAAEREGADVIVLGRASPQPGAGPGETVHGTVRRTRVPCVVAPAGAGGFRRVLAAVDGGPDSGDVLRAALALARPWAAELCAVHVQQPVLAGAGAGPWTAGAGPDPVANHAEPPGGPAEVAGYVVMIRRGDPVAEILRAVREGGVELLALGHHRGGPVVHTPGTGDVAARLLQRAPCAVLTVPI